MQLYWLWLGGECADCTAPVLTQVLGSQKYMGHGTDLFATWFAHLDWSTCCMNHCSVRTNFDNICIPMTQGYIINPWGVILTLLYPGGGHNDPPLAKSAPVLQGLHFEWPKLVDNSYLPLYYGVIFVSGPKIT